MGYHFLEDPTFMPATSWAEEAELRRLESGGGTKVMVCSEAGEAGEESDSNAYGYDDFGYENYHPMDEPPAV